MSTANQSTTSRSWHALDAAEVARVLNANTAEGLAGDVASQRLDQYGPNSLPKAPTPSAWSVALAILKDPMNLLLAITAIVGILVGQPDTAVLVAILVGLNVVLGTKQELAAQASVQALDTQQIPVARVRRGGAVEELEATALVPGDLLLIEAGDSVPLGPDSTGQHRPAPASTGQHRVMVPMKTDRMNNEITKRGVKPIPVECELGARNGGGIRCATLVTNRADS
jgi:magnesium-transporting ATPase (P-type)